ncbi:hypothetical protein AVEN_269977-1, partial [Araneus ventricosus]
SHHCVECQRKAEWKVTFAARTVVGVSPGSEELVGIEVRKFLMACWDLNQMIYEPLDPDLIPLGETISLEKPAPHLMNPPASLTIRTNHPFIQKKLG